MIDEQQWFKKKMFTCCLRHISQYWVLTNSNVLHNWVSNYHISSTCVTYISICTVVIFVGCPKGFWGNNCEQNCSTNCIDRHCNPTNGSCVWGCQERRTGSYCSKCKYFLDARIRLLQKAQHFLLLVTIWRCLRRVQTQTQMKLQYHGKNQKTIKR